MNETEETIMKTKTGMALYIAGVDQDERMKLNISSNENPYGCGSKVAGAIGGSISDINRYPDRMARRLCEAIGAKHNLNPARIFCGSGSSEIIRLIAQLRVKPGDEVIHTKYGFSLYPIVTNLFGGTPVAAPEDENYVLDIDAVLAKVTKHTKLVLISNPGNPTGTMVAKSVLQDLREKLRSDITLVIDEAYIEYAENGVANTCFDLMDENTLILRTFSKIYGMAGLRLGWCYAHESVVDEFNAICGPFNISSPSFNAGIAALEDDEFINMSAAKNRENRDWLRNELSRCGLRSIPSETNFLLVKLPQEITAKETYEYLLGHGYAIRWFDSEIYKHFIRITIAENAICRRVTKLLLELMHDKGCVTEAIYRLLANDMKDY